MHSSLALTRRPKLGEVLPTNEQSMGALKLEIVWCWEGNATKWDGDEEGVEYLGRYRVQALQLLASVADFWVGKFLCGLRRQALIGRRLTVRPSTRGKRGSYISC